MTLPHQYPYNPRVWAILGLFSCGFLWTAARLAPVWLLSGRIPTGFRLWSSLFGLIPIALALIVGVRRILVNRYVLLDNDCMVRPIGLFQMRTATIEYTSIRRVWEHYTFYYAVLVLKVTTEKQTFDIVSTLLPDNESYCALEEFLRKKAVENTRPKKSSRN